METNVYRAVRYLYDRGVLDFFLEALLPHSRFLTLPRAITGDEDRVGRDGRVPLAEGGICFAPRCDGNGDPIVKLLPSVGMGTGNAHLLLTWDGNGTGSWDMFRSCGGKGSRTRRQRDGTALAYRIEKLENS